ncbi:MAG: TrkH family potassium uptake protein, partial [Christensenellales bacterium]
AYCNAGFSLFSDNLANYCGDIAVNLVITSLIIIGGIGITVVIDLRNCLTNRKRKLSLHSKMALLITAVLLIIGTISIFVFEFNNPKSMAGFPLPSKILGAYFQSVTARTAGFNTLPIGAFNQITLFFIMIIMFIGASPGSTGGGIKTTTFGVIMVLVRSIIKGKKEVEVFRRGIPQNTIFKALTILIISLGVVLMGTMILLISEPFSLMEILFEEVSAFGTVGLSTGITPYLSSVGKLVIVSTMFLGRLGPLTLAFALTERLRQKSQVRYPEEKITVG